MFTKILIANRGEIAARVMATARRLGIATVAVHSDADAGALHVRHADVAVRIGPAPAAESYLDQQAILEAARATGAEAIHPGYGFLSENPEFVDAVEAAGLVFIGPPAQAIRAMGLKDAAKALMEKAGVPVVPGYHGADQDPGLLAQEAERIGYPVLIKARAGGGGKGMRLVERPQDFARLLEGAQGEARASFGDAGVLVEKYVTSPRHIEIQVFADAHGNTVHLFERDCSLQRRHQKVIEEAPAPDRPEAVRAAMGRAAVEAARAVGYVGAGTVEFIADGAGGLTEDGFWFMEMNTRLQVEHPVSEAITGLDFVELQLRVAAGEPLPFAQGDLTITGHAVEARLYAEDAAKGFLPATGPLDHLRLPPHAAFARAPVRIDSGVEAGDAITPWYDPMIAKVIVHAPDRAAALARLARTLDETEVAGCTTNRAFLAALCRDADFAAGRLDTGLIARKADALTAAAPPSRNALALAALLAEGLLDPADPADPWQALAGYAHWAPMDRPVTLHIGDREATLTLAVEAPGRFRIADAEGARTLAVQQLGAGRYRLGEESLSQTLSAVRLTDRVHVFDRGQSHAFASPDPLAAAGEAGQGGDHVAAPMPGLVRRVTAAPGAAVARGDPLLVLEAMKMEHTLTAPRDGTVAEVLAEEGQQVAEGARLIVLEPDDA
ncbi:acetyl/propionyl/methylcrotonyl-CoA carboxylase subunit alpha [Oceaniglobus roseus]|uniref:acetyl/propionyl/methylcrotonyl-CoA carboxylase subunit alpha n=1 Tax=Oceaniglobus roseus TaxID=1737570 RepID=UPI000C7F29F9|nr:acetyl/propionyl/methylcrotonyl-CoA carboxylase subunit alpha [Kandeliimicrobium roseum]